MDKIAEILNQYFNQAYANTMVKLLAEDDRIGIDSNDLTYADLESISNQVNQIDAFGATWSTTGVKINKLNFSADDGRTKYLRLDVLPTNGKSFNHIMDTPETGISVFELDSNGNPILNNLQLVESFSGRANLIATIVTGDRIGTGFDGEPLIADAKYIQKAHVNFQSITADVMTANFKTKQTTEWNGRNTYLGIFYCEATNNHIYDYLDFEYSNPVDGFDVRMGKERLHND